MQPTFWCLVKLHKWTRWNVEKTARADHDGFKNVVYEELRRECYCCGVPDRKVVWEKVK